MKKITKNLLLPVIAVLGLTSCGAPKVEPEVAKQRAQKITEVQESKEFELPKKFYIDEDSTIQVNNGDNKATANTTSIMSVDIENFQVYMSSKITGVEITESSLSMWMYLEGNTFYSVAEVNDKKTYTKVTVEINDFNFAEAASEVINQIYDFLTGSSYLDLKQYEKVSNEVTNAVDIDFGTPTLTYTSTGEGNLGISQKASIKTSFTMNSQTFSAKGSSSLNVQFDNYILSSLKSDSSLSLNANGEKTEINSKIRTNVHLNKAKFNKPDLSNFTEETGK